MLDIRVKMKLKSGGASYTNYYAFNARTDEWGILRYNLTNWPEGMSYCLDGEYSKDLPATTHDFDTLYEFMTVLIEAVESGSHEIDTIVYQLAKEVDFE